MVYTVQLCSSTSATSPLGCTQHVLVRHISWMIRKRPSQLSGHARNPPEYKQPPQCLRGTGWTAAHSDRLGTTPVLLLSDRGTTLKCAGCLLQKTHARSPGGSARKIRTRAALRYVTPSHRAQRKCVAVQHLIYNHYNTHKTVMTSWFENLKHSPKPWKSKPHARAMSDN